MSDSITETRGTHSARHHALGEPAPTSEAQKTQMLHDTPDAIEEERLRRSTSDSSREPRLPGVRQIRWVRASDVLSGASGRVAGHGIRVTHIVHRPTQVLKPTVRRGPETREAIRSDRTSRLAPLSAYGASRDVHGAAMSVQR
jgi:hypothetical protein